MPDPSTLLLLACTNCVSAPPSAPELPDAQCSQVQNPLAADQAVTARPCVSTPETDTDHVPLHSSKTQDPSFASDAALSSSPYLRLGSRGETVAQLQTKLQELGHYQGIIDGAYGPLTRVAVSAYQQAAQLKVDGVVGATTWDALQSASLEAEAAAREAVFPNAADPAPQVAMNSATSDDGVDPSAEAVSAPSSAVESQTPSPQAADADQADADINPEATQPPLVYKKSQLALPLAWIAGVSVAAGLVLLFKNRGVLVQQWQLQFQDGWALPGGSPSGYGNDSAQSTQPVVLEQSKTWSRAIVWSIAGVTSFVVIWSFGAKVEETVPVKGKLEPKSAVKEIQAPVGGVIERIHVEEGEPVEAGELLVSFDPTTARAQFDSLQAIHTALIEENKFYRSQLQPTSVSSTDEFNRGRSNVSPRLISLTENRSTLVAENQLYRAELSGDADGASLSVEQKERFASQTTE